MIRNLREVGRDVRDGASADPGSPSEGHLDLLESAGAAVLAAWPEEGRGSVEEVRRELEAVARWVRTFRVTGETTEPEECYGDRFLVRRLIEALRLETLRRWADGEDGASPEDVLEVLRALEELSRSTLPKDARDFASRLADPDGFELLVEVAHDLRSPLTSISFLAETLRSGHSGE
ncbi:MAG TPA: hypothetical protein VE173_15905, partial [Longimicrobiales bacterium]|nr:hypothetical protein [Longimicrobiales bacterium]